MKAAIFLVLPFMQNSIFEENAWSEVQKNQHVEALGDVLEVGWLVLSRLSKFIYF